MKGIYKITQKSTGKVYIGQSINIDNRWNQHAFSIDNLSFHEQYRHNPTDFTFEVLIQNDSYTKDDLDKLEKRYIADYHSNDSKYGFNATAGNGKLKEITKSRMLMVKGSIDRMMNKNFLRGVENKKILVIGNFNISETSLYNDMTILTDDFDYTCETAKIIRVEGGDEIMAQLNNMKDEKFDLIIANPPYNMGNKIISNCVDKAKECVVLMPFSKYKANELYKHVLSLEIVDPKAFKDAVITTNLCVCKLIPNKIERTFEELEIETFDQRFQKYYSENLRREEPWTWKTINDRKLLKRLCEDNKTFFLTVRSILDGVHTKESSQDIQANLHKTIITDCLDAITFKTELEKINIQKWWYSSKIASGLCWATNKQGGMGTHPIFLPRVDWTHEWADEQILKEFKYTNEELLQIMKDELKRK